MRVLLLGATGLVGGEVLPLLLADESIERVVAVARRPTGHRHPKLDEHVFDLGEIEQHAGIFAVDTVLCALGTTMRAAGTHERFRYVDYDLPLTAARAGLGHGATHYVLVTSLGANPRSRIFYNRVKGEVERDLLALPYPKVTIARPSFLLGPRREFRLGEKIVAGVGWLMPPRARPIEAHLVARALVALAKREEAGPRVVESAALRAIAAAGTPS